MRKHFAQCVAIAVLLMLPLRSIGVEESVSVEALMVRVDPSVAAECVAEGGCVLVSCRRADAWRASAFAEGRRLAEVTCVSLVKLP